MRRFFTYLFLVTASQIFAQINLVPNPSFEDKEYCPNGNVYKAAGWFSPTSTTPDIYRDSGNIGACWELCEWVGVDHYANGQGFQLPRSGYAYAGIKTLGSMPGDTREYITVQLSDTLEAGKMYCVSFYTSLADYSGYAFDKIGVYFSSTAPVNCSTATIIANNIFTNDSGNVILDTANWVFVSDTFVATGGELFISLGNFVNDSELQIVSTGFGAQQAFHYFDDISVVYCDSVIVPPPPPPPVYSEFTLFPNLSNGEFNISGNFPEGTQFEVYNMLGQRVYYDELQSGNQLQTFYLTLAEGAYIYRVQSSGATLKSGKLVISH